MDDQSLWEIADSPEFQRRWRGRAHPLLRANGGVDFYNIESLTQRLRHAEQQLATQPKWGLSGRSRGHYPSVLRDWMRQIEWISTYADRV